MRRLFWLAVGAGLAGVAARRANRVMHAFTPAGVADRVDGLGELFRDFVDDVREGMAEREVELRQSLGLDADVDARPGAGGSADGDLDRKDGY